MSNADISKLRGEVQYAESAYEDAKLAFFAGDSTLNGLRRIADRLAVAKKALSEAEQVSR